MSQRLARRIYNATGASELDFLLRPEDICEPPDEWPAPHHRPAPGQQLTIGWICWPPSAGSGGHTTAFRMVEALEDAGHRCVIYLHEQNGTDVSFHQQTIRTSWPRMHAQVSDTSDDLSKCDVLIATSWPTAHVLGSLSQSIETVRMYFIQDYEPYFHPRGMDYVLAEKTYGFGFHNIALGKMVGQLIDSFGEMSTVDFSCDTEVYTHRNHALRRGIVCYMRLDTPRRGTRLAILALEQFHRMHPDQPIHLFGDAVPNLAFPAIHHGRITPDELAELYNGCIAGLGLSFTNISLVVEEMLACGTIPIVNDHPFARADMPSPMVIWAEATPHALAMALSDAVSTVTPAIARVAAESVRFDNWSTPRKDFVRIVESQVYGGEA